MSMRDTPKPSPNEEPMFDAYEQHPESFVNKVPTPPTLNTEVWINRLSEEEMKKSP
jgi:putative transposase